MRRVGGMTLTSCQKQLSWVWNGRARAHVCRLVWSFDEIKQRTPQRDRTSC
ncbi:hypothetical protein HBI56_021520 [Parastagonospora nodorum]|uniref:Uncharacterized protein n=1 Tax=Phaeosphaeria nodorum (strain SN15 / ATCC MYA-4574 / FGSC 10173) TaxID=321614 RepID=A0A7U2F465_PHANO|nr:hypothetical protein HBH56_174490 [Parastagonospora nodorum]QRC96350.1 hypothetical protein JI435_408790 [Parastagonospora nodorum SN15]KAH3926341.1 hypothetical protein HBH54_168660 [Parastagonospora nodorum]KAH3971454.1 hypothetical protein HBH51_111020 [Parastagonospora nodorum]KAH4041273.1 hypothetical protein HBI09_020500 [Parastagonospora nodorum]